jgi:hypothetical protein
MTNVEWNKQFSCSVMVPVQSDGPSGASGRIVIDWRGIPLAVPYHFDGIAPGQRMPIAKCWDEGGNFMVKLVRPGKGTTVDYAIRCLFNPTNGEVRTNRLFAFLEMAPGCPKQDQTVPVWTVVEVMRPAAILVLEPEEIERERSFIEEIVEKRLSVPRDAIEATFGEMRPWTNPDWGDDGNIHLVCVKCLESLPESGAVCPRCVNSSQPQ